MGDSAHLRTSRLQQAPEPLSDGAADAQGPQWLRPVGPLGVELVSYVRLQAGARYEERPPLAVKQTERFLQISERYCSTVASPYIGLAAEAMELRQPRKTLTDDHIAFGALVYCSSRLLWNSFMSWLLDQLRCGKL